MKFLKIFSLYVFLSYHLWSFPNSGLGIEIDNPFLPWEISGTDECNLLWQPDIAKLNVGDFAILQDDFGSTKTLVESLSINTTESVIKWSVYDTGNYHKPRLLDYVFFTYQNYSGRLIKMSKGLLSENIKTPIKTKCLKSHITKVQYQTKLSQQVLEADFYTFTALYSQLDSNETNNAEQVFVWAKSGLTPLFQIIQLAKPYPHYVCTTNGSEKQSCQVQIQLKKTRLVQVGNKESAQPEL